MFLCNNLLACISQIICVPFTRICWYPTLIVFPQVWTKCQIHEIPCNGGPYLNCATFEVVSTQLPELPESWALARSRSATSTMYYFRYYQWHFMDRGNFCCCIKMQAVPSAGVVTARAEGTVSISI